MRPTALVLNILVAGIATVQFYRSGSFSWHLFWPFALTSIPFAFIGGSLTLPGVIYKPIVGLVLLYAAVRLFWVVPSASSSELRPVPRWAALLIGLIDTMGRAFMADLMGLAMSHAAAQTAGPTIASMLIYLLMAGVLFFRPQGLFPPRGR